MKGKPMNPLITFEHKSHDKGCWRCSHFDAVTVGSTFDSSQLVLTHCMGYQNVKEARLQELRNKHRPIVMTALEERSKGLPVWRNSQDLASKLYNFKQDPEIIIIEANKPQCEKTNGDISHMEPGSNNANEFIIGLSGDLEVDGVPDLQEQKEEILSSSFMELNDLGVPLLNVNLIVEATYNLHSAMVFISASRIAIPSPQIYLTDIDIEYLGISVTEFEETVAQSFFDLEKPNQDLKCDLKDLFITSVVQLDVSGNRKLLPSLHGIFSETNQSGLAAFTSYALAFPSSFLALIDTYDIISSTDWKKEKSDGSDSGEENLSNKDLALKQALDQITNSFGKGYSMWLGRSIAPKNVPVVSKGSFALDIALGIGAEVCLEQSVHSRMVLPWK
ncbi:DNA recombination and repair protein RecA [Dillenia turbinata]|uniref:DNA recombination and repair protein RecA n=1 Tax=Dillenia turbinata TaxID=194707 RepID=A0AAN8YR90_9MAGN